MTDYTVRFIEFSKPIIEATKSIFETMVFTEIHPQKPQMKDGTKSQGDVSAVIGLAGKLAKDGSEKDFTGMLVISFPEQTYIKVASAMLMEDYAELTDEIADVGAEIANIVTGNAKRSLAEMGYKIDMSVPTTITGKEHVLKYPEKTRVIMIPVECAHGQFFLEICYKD